MRSFGFCLLVATFLAAAPAVRASCGDGVVDVGEDCDDGSGQNGGTNSCCRTDCKFSGKSPDVIVGDLIDTMRYGTSGGITAYSVGTYSCNPGSCWLNWISNTNEHPVIGQNMFRLKSGRFEQIGQSWLKHGFTALTDTICGGSCVAPPSGAHLGVQCSDPYVASLNGSQARLGPKGEVNPSTGVYPYPPLQGTCSGSGARCRCSAGSGTCTSADCPTGQTCSTTGNVIYKRLQVHNTDLDPAQNAGALYFVEGQYVTHDDATAKNQNNNASYRPVTVGASPYNLSFSGATVRMKAGIQAWKAQDPSVTEVTVQAGDGIMYLSAKATSLGGGIYHYEYALQNQNSDRGAQSFSVPIPAGTVITNVGFHDVDYHSGEPFDGTDWPGVVGVGSVSWETTPYATNQNANALRWSTLYNFRFDANLAPGTGSAVIGMFKPGSPASVSVTTVTPGSCAGAVDGSPCNDGNACTLSDTCQAGACTGSNPVVCTASDQCHNAGTCDTATGVCSNPQKANGTACNDANGCTQTDTCQAGVCSGGNPIVCTASDQCHLAGTCNSGTGLCSNPAKPNGAICNDANACTQTDLCQAGVCVGTPVVCTASDQCHLPGTCNSGTGTCSNPAKPDGTTCSDANVCTQTDTCQSGACVGANPVQCSASDQCHAAGTCNPGTGQCSNPAKPNGSACSDGNACTQTDTCQSGACAGSNPVACAASDTCHDAGTCDPGSGACSNPVRPDGSSCSDGDSCTQSDACLSGVCAGSNPVQCAASDPCHEVGTCNPSTGVCSDPPVADGTECSDSNLCTQLDSCQAGVCAGASPVQCSALDACHVAGVCQPANGYCSNPAAPDGTPCDDANSCTTGDACSAGACVGNGSPTPPDVGNQVTLSRSGGITTISWAAVPDATRYDVLRGLVSGLPVGPGGGDEVCLDDDVAGMSVVDAADPASGDAFWYLVQGENACGKGPEGFAAQNGTPMGPRTSTTCP